MCPVGCSSSIENEEDGKDKISEERFKDLSGIKEGGVKDEKEDTKGGIRDESEGGNGGIKDESEEGEIYKDESEGHKNSGGETQYWHPVTVSLNQSLEHRC